MAKMSIVIPGQTRSKKNSRTVKRFGKKLIPTPADNYLSWAEQALWHLKKYPKWTGSYPVELKFFFYRENKRKFDFSNLVEGPQDVLQQAGIIEDDDMNHVYPVILGWAVDKNQPRVEIIIKRRQDCGQREKHKDENEGHQRENKGMAKICFLKR